MSVPIPIPIPMNAEVPVSRFRNGPKYISEFKR